MKGKELIRGLSGNAGVAIGTVKVINGDKTKITQIKQGDVIIADKWADPSDDPYLMKGAALVQNVGGLSNHGNIKSKSLGIPSIVGTIGVSGEEATKVLKDGQMVVVEGMAGYEDVKDKTGQLIKRPYGAIYEYIPDKAGLPPVKPSVSTPPPAGTPQKISMADLMKKYNIKK
jgi:phosphohistidine swiveling domain-containing protein